MAGILGWGGGCWPQNGSHQVGGRSTSKTFSIPQTQRLVRQQSSRTWVVKKHFGDKVLGSIRSSWSSTQLWMLFTHPCNNAWTLETVSRDWQTGVLPPPALPKRTGGCVPTAGGSHSSVFLERRRRTFWSFLWNSSTAGVQPVYMCFVELKKVVHRGPWVFLRGRGPPCPIFQVLSLASGLGVRSKKKEEAELTSRRLEPCVTIERRLPRTYQSPQFGLCLRY